MANQIEQLAAWMINRADQLGWTLQQCSQIKMEQLRSQLPAAYRQLLNETIFQKAKALLLHNRYKSQLQGLAANTNIRSAILAKFPNATFRITNGRRKRIIIDLLGDS
jgi:hypothetical protein